MAIKTESTSFTKDVQGRYLCNDLAEVDAWRNVGGRPFDVLVVGGGTFGVAIAEHIWFRQKQAGGGTRTLVVEPGQYVLDEHAQNAGILGFGAWGGVGASAGAEGELPPVLRTPGVRWPAASRKDVVYACPTPC
jgi:hypothetical protein